MAACGGGSSAPATPIVPTPVVELPLVLHDTLNPPGGAANIQLPISSLRSGLNETWAIDDFVIAANTAVRIVRWQGIYSPVRPTGATRFHVAFLPDNGSGTAPSPEIDPATRRGVAIYRGEFPIDQVNERLDVVVPCPNSQLQCSLYDYSVTLPTPLPITQGVRYWLVIQAEAPFNSNALITWGWRRGEPDNQRSRSHIANATLPFDFAFALER
jgi:hypothetical protein